MDNETRKRAADRDADEALDAILREIDLADRRKPSAAEDVEIPAPRRSSRPDPERRRRSESEERSRGENEDRTRSERTERPRPAQSRPVSHAKEPERSTETEERPASAQQRPAQRHRLPAAAERPEERSQRLAAERAQNAERSGERPVRRMPAERPVRSERPAEQRPQRSAEQRTQRPAEQRAQRPAEQRTQRSAEQRSQRSAEQRTQRPAERTAAQRPQRTAPAAETAAKPAVKRPAQQGSGSTEAVKRKPSAFRIGMALYIIIFMLITMFLMHRLHVYLTEYETSLPQRTIDGYVSGLNSGFYTDMVRQHVDQIPVSAYETPDSISETLDIENIQAEKFTWSKNVEKYTDEAPSYLIRCGNAAIATVDLKRIGGTENFDFPVWQACPAVSLIEVASEPVYSLDVTVPDGAQVMVNGVAVPFEEMEKSEAGLQLDAAAQQYAQQPESLHAEIDGLYVAPKVQAYDSLGNPLTAYKTPDASETQQIYVFGPKEESSPDEELVDRVKAMMREYIDYMVNKDETLDINLAALDHYLVYQSSAYQKLHSMRGDIYWNNPYTNRVDRALNVSNVRMYSETLFTCDVHYDYQLTMNVVNDYIGDMRWTFVKAGDEWKATDFEITGSNDTKFEDPDQTAPAQEG